MMNSINTLKTPNPAESRYWVDLKENPYGGTIKYYDDHNDEWVYLDEPRFQQSAASKLTEENLSFIGEITDVPQCIQNLQLQINNLENTKLDISDALTKDDAVSIHDELTVKINKNTGDIVTVNTNLTNRIEEVDTTLSNEIDELREVVEIGYDDTEIRNTLASKASYTYVEQQIQKITGVPPTVLDTLEELSAAIGYDPNFAVTIAEKLGSKLDREQTIELFKEVAPTLIVESDPTVPAWAKKSTKPTYTASEVGALPASTVVPELTSQLTNDAGFLTQLEVNTLIAAHKPLTTEQYAKINKIDTYVVYNLSEGNLELPLNYDTIIAIVPDTITELNVSFSDTPTAGSKYRLYIKCAHSLTVNFYTLTSTLFHTVAISTATRFDITTIDITDHSAVTESGETITTEGGATIILNVVDGYILDYITASNLLI